MTHTSRDFPFVARHHLRDKKGAAAHPHWHSYVATFSLRRAMDQDDLIAYLCKKFSRLHGSDLTKIISDTTDEGLAQWLLSQTKGIKCITVTIVTDGQRRAEAW